MVVLHESAGGGRGGGADTMSELAQAATLLEVVRVQCRGWAVEECVKVG